MIPWQGVIPAFLLLKLLHPQRLHQKPSQARVVCMLLTPESARAMLPAGVGVNIQHKTPNSGSASAGWQAWVSPSLPSRWFGYGEMSAYPNKDTALQAAVAWLRLWEVFEEC